MKKLAKKRIGRPRGRKALHRPVLSTRVPMSVYEEIKDAAARNNRTMSEELIHRAVNFCVVQKDDEILERLKRIEAVMFAPFKAGSNEQ